MYAYITHVCIYVLMCVCEYVCLNTDCAQVYIHAYVCMMCVYIYMDECVFIYVVSIYMCTHVCTCVYLST